MKEEFRPAIEALQKRLGEYERKASEIKNTINHLCEEAGEPAMYADTRAASAAPTVTSIKPDTFYGKVVTTAAREYLEMRKAANLGPASPREIFEAMRLGGYAFDTKDENNAITGVRNVLRKNSSIFHRLPGGEYGLLVWYPRARRPHPVMQALEELAPADEESEVRTAAE